MRHTPGPWHVIKGDEWTSGIATDTPEQGVWEVASANKRRDEFEANKALIAAAPDLLEVLELAFDACSALAFHQDQLGIKCICSDCVEKKARAAIAKAKGE